MASQNPPVKNVAHTFYISLVSQADTRLFQVNPTLAAGDVKVAIDDGAPANLGTLPVVDADFTKRVKVVMASGEMNGDNISIIFSDAAGLEWCDMTINLQTVLRKFDDLAFPVTSGNGIDVTATGAVGIDWGNIENQGGVNNFSNSIISMANVIRTNGAQAGSASTITLDAGASSTDDIYKGQIIWLASGLGVGQTRLITGYVGATKVVTVSPNWTTSPTTSTGFAILPAGYIPGLAAGAIVAATFGAGAIDNAAIATDAIGSAELAASAVAEIVAAVLDDPVVEPTATFTWAGATPRKIIGWLGALARNKMTQTATTTKLRNDADSGDISTSTVSDDGATFTRGEFT